MEKARSRRRLRRTAAVVAAALALSAATPAYAAGGNASDDQYGGVLGEQSGSGPGASGGALPFTGLDLVVLAGAGTGLTAAGLGIRRLARSG